MDYLAYRFTVTPPSPGAEVLAAMIADMGFESFEQHDDGFTAYIPLENQTSVDLDGLEFPDFTFTYTAKTITGTNWNEEWEKNFDPVTVDDLLRIRAPFHEPQSGFREEIVIMPKMSFGTGHHETTRLVCRQMFSMPLKDAPVLDMGTGTGILAILACRLGARRIKAADNDAWSVENARENCTVNGCSEIEVVDAAEVPPPTGEGYNFIFANINRNVLKMQMADYAKYLSAEGQLVMSGFFISDIPELEAEAQKHHLFVTTTAAEQDWAVMVLKRTT